MKIHADIVQGTQEWRRLRAGIPTASAFDNIVTPTGKKSTQDEKYRFMLLAERMMGHPIDDSKSKWMLRGQDMEGEARAFYEFQRDLPVELIGFVTNDAGTIGASPDAFVGDEGTLEIKCPSEAIHVSYLLKKSVDAAYYPQVQGQLWITERKWADILSYHPELPPALIRVERDEPFIKTLSELVTAFSEELEKQFLILVERGWVTENPKKPAMPAGGVPIEPLPDLETLVKSALLSGQRPPHW